jgi:hypothetical protein
MNGLFAFLFLISLSALIVGVIKPSIFTRFFKRGVGWKQIAFISGGLSIILLCFIGITAERTIDGTSTAPSSQGLEFELRMDTKVEWVYNFINNT